MSGRLDELQSLRDDLRNWMDEAPVDRKAALVAQYRATLEEIDELTPKEAVGDLSPLFSTTTASGKAETVWKKPERDRALSPW